MGADWGSMLRTMLLGTAAGTIAGVGISGRFMPVVLGSLWP
jgi:hypothetical protein